ncbi:MAG: glycosyltransferase, partial [Anaerolineae bacterium]|nr:glycosyltransferase [Anaerolineae bacterium]
MNIGILLPGFSSDEHDWAIPVQLNLVREMARQDDVRVLALRYPHRKDRYRVHDADVIALGAGQARGLGRLRLWWDALRMLRRLHREKPFDVLHAMWADETGLIAVWAGWLLHIPVVVSIAGGELAGFADIKYGLQRGAFSQWIVGQALRADAVIPACSYTRRLIAQAGYHVPENRIRQITLGVDTALFTPGEHPAAGKTLIHAASLVGVKDQAVLLRAFARLDEDVSLVIVGEGPERGRLESLAAELGITNRVQFTGAVHHLDMPDYYRRAALNVLTSRHEGLGMVTLEAAACGLPTISTAVGLLPDVPEMGLTVPVGADAALAAAIQSLLDDEGRRAALA